jgi:hypothetical protein
MVLHVTAGIAILACAVAIAVAPSAPDLWRPPAVLGAGMSPRRLRPLRVLVMVGARGLAPP